MLKSRFCDYVGIKYPIIQAGMGPFPTTELAIASANAGILGIMSSAPNLDGTDNNPIYEAFTLAAGAKIGDDFGTIIEKMLIKAYEQTKASQGIFGINVMVSQERLQWSKIVIDTAIKLRNENPEMKKRFRVLYTSAGDPMPWGDLVNANDFCWIHVVPSVKGAQRCKKSRYKRNRCFR
jgi:NAD(P)H-dependent flavin oxidoreductase YrpB (nitropropane dioxygenase family)